MITEQELKEKCTPEFTKWMCEYAEGFEYQGDDEIFYNSLRVDRNILLFPLLIHRAIEGASKKYSKQFITGVDYEDEECYIITTDSISVKSYLFKNYQPQSLTQAECAMLHCLLDIFSEQEERDE